MSGEIDASFGEPRNGGSCAPFRANLVPCLDGELAEAARLELEGHLAACASCSRELAEHRRIAAILLASAASGPSGPPDLADRVRAGWRARRLHARRAWFAGAALAACVLLATGLLLRGRQGSAPDPAEGILANLDVLEAFQEEGVEPTEEVVRLLLETVPEDPAELDPAVLELLFDEGLGDG